jgi:hypothetical protein
MLVEFGIGKCIQMGLVAHISTAPDIITAGTGVNHPI